MKGTFFQKPLEFRLDVQGETWNQGDTIAGSLTVKNHGNEPLAQDRFRVCAVFGKLKEVRAKDADGIRELTSLHGAGGSLAPQGEYTLPWSFQTDRNFPITDHLSSSFILYGHGEGWENYGQIQLTVKPDPVIQEFLEIFVISFRFVVKSLKCSKGTVEAKLAPPDAKGFSSVEQLLLHLRFEGETLEVSYTFSVKKVEATASAADVKKAKKTFEQSFTPIQYRTLSGRFNHEPLEAAVREVMTQIESKVLF